jgi:parallel beta-helix repeat protein
VVLTTSVKVSPNTIYVPGDYAKIQWAIGNASAGDTIIVRAGIYYEAVMIDKSLTIKGENGNTIIDGNDTGHVVRIYANNVSVSGFTIQNGGPNDWDSAVYFYNSSWCNISYNILKNSGEGIHIDYYSSNNIIFENNVSYNKVGIDLDFSNNNTLMNNYVFSSVHCGIAFGSSNNSILTNNVAKSNEYGIWLYHSTTNVTIARNTVVDNLHGIYIDHSDNDTIFHNNFINNTYQTEIIDSASTWTNDFEGNYWSNYVGSDADHDGIGDTAHMIDANNTDNYPLMGAFSDFTVTWEEQLHHVTTICNSTISNFNFTDTYNGSMKAIIFNVTGENETAGFCRIRIPTTLINNTFTVYVDGVNTTYTLLPRSNATYSYLYFTYNHSTKKVIIIPEFPSTLLLYLLMTLTLAATAYSKKKKKCSQNSTL